MASITIAEQESGLTPLLAAIQGVTTVFPDWPDEVQARELPALIYSPRAATYDERSQGEHRFTIRREWMIFFLAEIAVKGREFQSQRALKPFLTSISDQLEQYPRVKLSDGRSFGLELHQGGDDGLSPAGVKYNGVFYIGTTFRFFTVTTSRIEPA